MTNKQDGKDIFFSHNPNPMWIYNPADLSIVEVNEAATKLYGYAREEMITMGIQDLHHKSELPRLERIMEQLGQSFRDSGVWKHQKRNEELLYAHILSYPIKWEDTMCRLVVTQDVTEKYLIDKKLRQSRAQLQKIMDQSPAVICTISRDGAFVQVSAAARRIWGYPPRDLVGEKYICFVHPDDAASTSEIAEEVIKGRVVTDFENRYIGMDGKIVPMEWSARWDNDDEVMYCVGRDATAIKEARKEVALERKMLRAIINNIPDYVYVKDRKRRLILSNKALNEEVFGIESAKEALGKTAYGIYPPEVAKPIDDDDREVLETGRPIVDRLETTHNHRGEKLWLLTTKVPLRNQNNEIYGLVGVTRNITERKKVQDEIKRTKERYELALRASKDTVFDWNFATNKLTWGSSFITDFDHTSDLGKFTAERWMEHIHPEDRQRVQESLNQVLEDPSQSQWEVEYRYLNMQETYSVFLENAFIIRDEEGIPVRMIGALQDITTLRQKEQAIRESLKEKETLLTEIHHRVKNNLAIISGMLQLQAFEEEDNVRDKLLNSVRRIQSIALIHEHLYQSDSFSRLNFSENLKELACNIIDAFKSGKDIKFNCKLNPVQLNINQALPASLIVNEVLTNTLKHAFKEKDAGKITLKLYQAGRQVALEIKDNGAGLPKEFNSKDKTLGLVIINELAKQLDAGYTYESPGQGTVFTLRFNKADLNGIGSYKL